ncbi:hypothetical protein G9464_05600 [Halostella sp. JP-L12]|uniref:hypothetical protein n=1 Tax=Halostella TaxID=1843185 RepID=UPI000EF7E3FE|nr:MULTISPECIES: hypothetical protein [Halostella]NHN47072.1 hypothetical protein [Halostella sp. JP-L12]
MSGSTTSDAPAGALRLRRTESVPADARVRHVDELSERAQQRLYGLLDDGETGVPLDDRTANEFTDGEVVVFTGYYEVDRN